MAKTHEKVADIELDISKSISAQRPVEVKRETHLNHLRDRINNVNSRVAKLTSNLRAINDRAFGCEPQADASGREATEPVGQLAEATDAMCHLEASANALAHEIERLSDLA